MRDRGSGAWPCASPALPRSRPRCGELREMASLCSLPFRRLKEGSIWNPGLRPMTQGLCSRGHGSLAPAASERVPPARARLSTCAPRVAIGFKATPENGQAFHRRGDTRTRSLWNPKPHQLSRTPRPSLRFWNLEFVKYSRSSQNVAPPRAPPRKWAPIMAFGRCSGTAPGLTPSFQLLHSLRDTGSSDNSASSGQKVVARQELLTSAELPHRELGLGQAPGPGHPQPTGLPHCLPHSSQPGLSPRPDPQPRGACTPPLAGCPGSLWPSPSTGHGLKEPRSIARCLHGRGALSLISLQWRCLWKP
nr:uncharacterized protein LOC106845977 isoform X2 [Equus asinus]